MGGESGSGSGEGGGTELLCTGLGLTRGVSSLPFPFRVWRGVGPLPTFFFVLFFFFLLILFVIFFFFFVFF